MYVQSGWKGLYCAACMLSQTGASAHLGHTVSQILGYPWLCTKLVFEGHFVTVFFFVLFFLLNVHIVFVKNKLFSDLRRVSGLNWNWISMSPLVLLKLRHKQVTTIYGSTQKTCSTRLTPDTAAQVLQVTVFSPAGT